MFTWMRSSHRWDLAEWLERLPANAKVATVLWSIPASSDTVKSLRAADEAVLNNVRTFAVGFTKRQKSHKHVNVQDIPTLSIKGQ